MKDFNAQTIVEIDAADFDNVEIHTNGGPGSNKFGFGWTSPEDFARREDGGPILSGPYLYGFGLCTSLSNGPITANRPKVFVRTGDVIAVRNLVRRGHLRMFYFEATVCPRGYVSFECVGGAEDNYATLGGGRDLRGHPLDIKQTEITKDEYLVHLNKQA
jgi:hypothetical protein